MGPWISGAVFAAMVFLILQYVKRKLWNLRENWDPFAYRDVAWDDMLGHVHEFCRRGEHGSRMVITDEDDGRSISIHKSFILAVDRVGIRLIVPWITKAHSLWRDVIGELERQGIECTFGPGDESGGGHELICFCGEYPDGQVLNAAKKLLGAFLCVKSTYTVRVDGGIAWCDMLNSDMRPVSEAEGGLPPGVPYKWRNSTGHTRSFVCSLFAVIFAWPKPRARIRKEAIKEQVTTQEQQSVSSVLEKLRTVEDVEGAK